MLVHDVTVVAQWTEIFVLPSSSSSSSEIVSDLVEVVLDVKNMTKEQVKKIIKQHTDEEFEIKEFEADEATGETAVIIRFTEAEKAGKFARKTKEAVSISSEAFIKHIKTVKNDESQSLSFVLAPCLAFMFIF